MALQLTKVHRFSLEIPDPFDFTRTVAKPAGWHWATPGETFERGTLWTGLYVRESPFGLRMSAEGNRVKVGVYAERPLRESLTGLLESEVRSGLGADEDLGGFYRFARKDSVLSAAVDHLSGMRIGMFDDLFGDTILAILLQMAPMSRSNRMMDAVLEHYGTAISFDGKQVTLWPRARDIAVVDPADLREKAKIGYRAERLVQAAQYLTLHPLSLKELSALPEDDAVKKLTEIPGIGPYSAGIILGTLPVDVWSVVILSELFLQKTPGNPREEIPEVVSRLTKRWGKWRWFAFVYVLNDLGYLAETYHLSRVT
jgi:3-methyladenine DNA glycosylase/8-oxoguanine DNA glycosylase